MLEIFLREEFEDLSKHPSSQYKLNQPQVQECEGDIQGVKDIGPATVPVKLQPIDDNAKGTLRPSYEITVCCLQNINVLDSDQLL